MADKLKPNQPIGDPAAISEAIDRLGGSIPQGIRNLLGQPQQPKPLPYGAVAPSVGGPSIRSNAESQANYAQIKRNLTNPNAQSMTQGINPVGQMPDMMNINIPNNINPAAQSTPMQQQAQAIALQRIKNGPQPQGRVLLDNNAQDFDTQVQQAIQKKKLEDQEDQ